MTNCLVREIIVVPQPEVSLLEYILEQCSLRNNECVGCIRKQTCDKFTGRFPHNNVIDPTRESPRPFIGELPSYGHPEGRKIRKVRCL